MENTTNIGRRRFLSMAALTVAVGEFGGVNLLKAEKRPVGSTAFFDNIKQIKAGVLDVGYAEAGPANGQPVI